MRTGGTRVYRYRCTLVIIFRGGAFVRDSTHVPISYACIVKRDTPRSAALSGLAPMRQLVEEKNRGSVNTGAPGATVSPIVFLLQHLSHRFRCSNQPLVPRATVTDNATNRVLFDPEILSDASSFNRSDHSKNVANEKLTIFE